jgi:hypothetical protein
MLIRLFALSGLLLCPLAVLAENAPAAVAPAAGTSMPDAPAVEAPKAFETEGVELYIKKDIMAQRASVDDMAAYTKALQGVADDYFTAQKDPWREDLDIVVAIKPGPIARVWLVSRIFPEPDDRLSDLRDKLAAVPAPAVNGGPVAFCIHSEVAGGNRQPPSKLGAPPFPKEWMDALAKAGINKPIPFDDLMALVSSTPPVNRWNQISGPLMMGGFVVAVLVGLGFNYRRNRKRKGR